MGASEEQVQSWARHWIATGFDALEQLVERHGAGFAYGGAPTIADCYLVPQLYSARRFNVDLSPYPRLRAAGDAAMKLPAVQAAHPDLQPDAGR